MPNDIGNPEYWKHRLSRAIANAEIHKAVFNCATETWKRIEHKHRAILQHHIQPHHSVIDAGCGYGALLNVLPGDWYGDYLGIDLSPDLVAHAKADHPQRMFWVGTLETALPQVLQTLTADPFDWIIFRSVRPMIKRELGVGAWDLVAAAARPVGKKFLFLEYDPQDDGSVE